jgi:hypothetical protein
MGFETDIERMYRAGKTDIPNAADRLSASPRCSSSTSRP